MTTTLPSPAVERYLFGFFSIGCLLAGYCVGSSNVTLSQQCAGQFSEDADPETSSKLVAAFSVGALAGCLLLMRLGDALGRRRVIRASAHAFLAGSLLTAGCPCPGQRGFDASATTAVLGTGRFLWGLGGALNFQATSQYVAEVMSQENRGFYLPLLSLVVVVGDLCGAAVGATAESLACGWRLAAAAMALPALALAHVANVLPDSPRWLALNAVARARGNKSGLGNGYKGRGDATAGFLLSDAGTPHATEYTAPSAPRTALNRTSVEGPNELSEARRALTVLHCTQPSRRSSFGIFRRGFPDVVPGAKQRAALERELENVLRVAKADAYEEESRSFSNDAWEKRNKTPKRLFADVRNSVAARRALFVALWLTVLGQLSAGPVIQYFPKHIFELAGHDAGDGDALSVSASSLTVWTSFFKVVATLIVATFVDSFGRRFFFAFGITAQLAACVVLALAFGNHGWDEDARGVRLPHWRGALADASVFLCLTGFQLGFASLTSPVIADVSPMRARTSIMAAASFLNWSLSVLLTWTFPKVNDEPGIRVMFLAYAAALAASLGFVARFVPETTGRTLEEVELVLAKSASLAGAVRVLSAGEGAGEGAGGESSRSTRAR